MQKLDLLAWVAFVHLSSLRYTVPLVRPNRAIKPNYTKILIQHRFGGLQ